MAIRRTEEMARKIWQTAQKEHEKLVNPVTTDDPDFDKAWNEDRLLQRLDDSESKMSIGEYAKYWFKKGQEVAYPKWTYCKDGMPSDKDGTIVFVKFGKDGKGRALAYYAGQWIEPFSVQIIKDVIAWMPLPEVEA